MYLTPFSPRSSTNMRLAVNAVSIAAGGGVNGLVGYLKAWQEIGADLDISLYASREEVIEAVRAARPDIRIVPFALGASSGRHFFLQQVALGKEIEQSGADVVMTTQTDVGRCRIPQLIHHRNLKRYEYDSPLPRIRRGQLGEAVKDLTARRSLRRSKCNVFISDHLRRQAERLVPESAPFNHVIYNGLSDDAIRAAEVHIEGWQGQPHLVAIQTPVEHKDNPTLLRTLAYLLKAEPDVPWQLSIAGACDWSEVKKMAADLGVLDRIRFLGYVSHEQLDPILRQSVCLVFTSVLEGFGNPPIEAMARSCPTVACNVTAMPEVIGDAGLLVEPRQAEQFGEAVRRLYHDRPLRQSLVERGLERIKRFRWTDSATRMLELLAGIADSNRPSEPRTPVRGPAHHSRGGFG